MTPKRLRSGFTTGTAAAAAAKAALQALLDPSPPGRVHIDFLSEGGVDIPVARVECLAADTALATVIKDAGDDPDVTHRAEIGARVTLAPGIPDQTSPLAVTIRGGQGVGTVTKPGLELPPGEAAINPGPRRMIRRALRQALGERALPARVTVEVFVPDGERLARKTLNARLGIIGGLSILGTTGVVKPMSHEAYTATIRSALGVARAAGGEAVALTTGRRSERYLQALWTDWAEEQFVQIGDYFQFAVATAAELAFGRIALAVFFGKAVKMAMGVPHTHAARSELVLDRLAEWTRDLTGSPDAAQSVRKANTAREAFERLYPEHPQVVARVGQAMIRHALAFAGGGLAVRSLIFDYQGRIAFDSGE